MIPVDTGDTDGAHVQIDRDDRGDRPDGRGGCPRAPGPATRWRATSSPDDPGLPFEPLEPVYVRCLGDDDYADLVVSAIWGLLVVVLLAGFILAVVRLPH
jgi:hypothetical protein